MIESCARRAAVLSLLLGFSSSAWSHHPLEAIRAAAGELVQSQLGPNASGSTVDVGQLDARLQLPECERPLETWFPSGPPRHGSAMVGVRCAGARPWSIYVPITLRNMAEVVVLAAPLPAGAVLSEADLRLEVRDIGDLPAGYFADPKELIGQVLARGAGAGTALNRLVVKAAVLVKRGDEVTLSASRGGFAVRMMGKALADAAPGQRIKVRNLSSNRVVEGVVGADRTVEIAM